MEVNSPLQQAWFHLSGLEQELQDLRHRLGELTSLINRSPVVIFRWRRAAGWPVVFVSENVRQFGYTPFDFTSGRVTWSGITHPDDAARLEGEMVANAARGVRNFTKRYRIFTKGGAIRWIEDYTAAIFDDAGDLTHYEGVLIDVTERKLAEEALRASEQQFASLFQSSPVSVSISRLADGHFLDVNEAFQRLSGYTRAEALGRSSVGLALLDAADRARIGELLDAGDERASMEMAYRAKTGVRRIGLFSGRRIEFKGEPATLMVMQDITAQKEVEEALRRSEHKFATLFHLAPLPIAISVLDSGELLDVNRACAEFLGYRTEELLGRTFAALGIVPETLHARLMQECDAQGVLGGIETHFRTRSGALRAAIVTGQQLELNGQRVLLSTLLDVTDRARADEALHRALDDHFTRLSSHHDAADAALARAEARYQALVAHLTVPVCRWLPDTTLTYVNAACCRLLGRPRGALLGRSWLGFLPEEAQEALREQSAKFVRRPREATVVRTFRAADGTPQTMRWIDIPIVQANLLVEIQSVGQDAAPLAPEAEPEE